MAAVDDFALVVEERDDRNDWIEARNALVAAMTEINRQYDILTQMGQEGIINDAPTDLRNILIWAYQQLDSFRTTMIGNQEYMDLHSWTPPV